MDRLQLAAIFCCVAIGNGNVLKRALLDPAVCVYGKQLTFIQLTSDGRLLIVVVAGHNQCRLLSVEYYSSARLEGSRRCQSVGKWFSISEPCTR